MIENINKKTISKIIIVLIVFAVALSFVFIFSGSAEAKYGCVNPGKKECEKAIDKCEKDGKNNSQRKSACTKAALDDNKNASESSRDGDAGKDNVLPKDQSETGQCVINGLKIPVCTEADAKASSDAEANNPIMVWIGFFVNVLSVIIVAGAAVMMAVAGLQYMTARDKAESVTAAKNKMTSVILGLIAYFFLFAFVQWLIPGGVF